MFPPLLLGNLLDLIQSLSLFIGLPLSTFRLAYCLSLNAFLISPRALHTLHSINLNVITLIISDEEQNNFALNYVIFLTFLFFQFS
jgi:hypothetical protein